MDAPNPPAVLDRFAAFYDLEYADYDEDMDFYLNYASIYAPLPPPNLPPKGGGMIDAKSKIQNPKSKILELGCGTGRLLVPLAAQGGEVTGVDASAAMLAVAGERLAAAGVADYALLTADMSSVNLPPDYRADLMLIALNTFQYLTSVEQQWATLRRLRPHLAAHGRLIIALTGPALWPSQSGRPDDSLYLQGSYPDHEGGTVQKWLTSRYDPATQLEQVTFIYDEVKLDGSLRRTLAPLTLRYTYRYEMEHLLAASGYQLERVYGSYDLDPFDANSAHMIFVAQ